MDESSDQTRNAAESQTEKSHSVTNGTEAAMPASRSHSTLSNSKKAQDYERSLQQNTLNAAHSHVQTVNSNRAPHISSNSSSTSPFPTVPPGVFAIYHACSKIYPDQPNPLQVNTVKKYW